MGEPQIDGRIVEDTDEPAQAFVVVHEGLEMRVVDLPRGASFSIGRNPSSTIRLGDVEAKDLHATLTFDGEQVVLVPHEPVHVAGKLTEERSLLEPGEELVIGATKLVVGVAVPLTAGGRRALRHEELRERLAEELARAARAGRSVAFALVLSKQGEGGRVVQAALESCRAGDLIAAYGPDATELLLPDIDAATAESVIGRVLELAGTKSHVGLALAPDDGDTAERVLRAALLAGDTAVRTGGTFSRPPRDDEPGTLEAYDPQSRDLLAQADRLGADGANVLLAGEPSTGKRLLAARIHARGRRSGGPFVVVSCPSIDDDADATRTFGGGAQEPLVARARGGTVLLAEVGDLSAPGQRRLREAIEREGDSIRWISTTQRALVGLAERGAFEQRLYELLAGAQLETLPLRSRPGDILPFAERFVAEASSNGAVAFSAAPLARLRSYPWPGNVLELRNAMHRAVLLAAGGEIRAEHLPSEPVPVESPKGRLREQVDSVERDAIARALAETNYNQTHAAKRLGISRRALIYKLEKYGLKRPPASRKP